MDDSEFEFPLDQVEADLPAESPAYTAVPLNILVSQPVENLPPTQPPGSEHLTILQRMRSASVLATHSAALHQSSAATTAAGHGDGSGPDGLSDEFSLESPLLPSATARPASSTAAQPSGWRWGSALRRPRTDWSESELRKFYSALSQYGTDFAATAVLFPTRSRADIKRLYHRELRRNEERVHKALRNKQPIDLETFSERLRDRREHERPPKKVLGTEEEDMLRSIANAAAVAPSPAVQEASTPEASGGGAPQEKKNLKRARAEQTTSLVIDVGAPPAQEDSGQTVSAKEEVPPLSARNEFYGEVVMPEDDDDFSF